MSKRKTVDEEFEDFNESDDDEYIPEAVVLNPSIQWISSHLNPRWILWSSHPDELKPTLQVQSSSHSSSNVAKNVEQTLTAAKQALQNASHVLVIAGAGMSCDCGLPDYRSQYGIWKNNFTLQTSSAASSSTTSNHSEGDINESSLQHIQLDCYDDPKYYTENPQLIWGIFTFKQELFLNATPHQGYGQLLQYLQTQNKDYFVFTSNIDCLFLKAGFPADKIFESHGSLQYLQCTKAPLECNQAVWPIPKTPEWWNRQNTSKESSTAEIIHLSDLSKIPKCPTCGSLARTNVSMQGDTTETFDDSRTGTRKAALLEWLQDSCNLDFRKFCAGKKKKQRKAPKIVILEIGCGSSLHSLSVESDALKEIYSDQVTLVRINTSTELNSEHALFIQEPAAEALSKLFS